MVMQDSLFAQSVKAYSILSAALPWVPWIGYSHSIDEYIYRLTIGEAKYGSFYCGTKTQRQLI